MKSKTEFFLVNLGPPDSYEPADVKEYLREFLLDEKVIDLPKPLRKFLVEGIILNTRPKESGEAYEAIWWEDGSPLIVISNRVLTKLRSKLGADIPISLGMRYGNPSIKSGIEELLVQNPDLEEVFLIPLYPQYAMATTETVTERTKGVIREFFPHLTLKLKEPFYNDSGYIQALGESMKPHLPDDLDHLLFLIMVCQNVILRNVILQATTASNSKTVVKTPSVAHAFCYRHQDLMTTKQVATYLDLDKKSYTYSNAFQSKLGIDPWLSPATDKELERLAKEGKKKVAVVCPAFISDCIETLEEIGIRGEEEFIEAGGEELILIPCVNDHDLWIDVLEAWCNEVLSESPIHEIV